MIRPIRAAVALSAIAAIFLFIPPVLAETIALKATLKGSNEVAPNDSAASGSAAATFDTETRKLAWVVTYSGLTGPAIGAHIHGPGQSGKNAGILVPFKFVNSPTKGSHIVSISQAKDLLAGLWYVNIHTGRHPGGELRGQLLR